MDFAFVRRCPETFFIPRRSPLHCSLRENIAKRFFSVAVAATVTLALFSIYKGGISETSRGFISGLFFSAPDASRIAFGNYSSLGLGINGIFAVLGHSTPLVDWLITHTWAPGIAYLCAVTAILFRRTLPFVIRLACAMSLLTMLTPLSLGYTLSFVFIVIAELLQMIFEEKLRDAIPTRLAILLAAAITVTLVPWPYVIHGTNSSVGTVIVPLGWLAFTAATLFEPRIRMPVCD